MPSAFATGLSGGAAANNVNVVQMHEGRVIARYTTVKAGAYAARAILSRLTANEYDKQAAFTVKTS
jgi:hypothetical protein